MLCTVCICSLVPDVFCRQHLLDIPLNEMGFKCLSVHPALVCQEWQNLIVVFNSGILQTFYCWVDGLNMTFVTSVKALVKDKTSKLVVITKVKELQQWVVIEVKPEHATIHSNPRTSLFRCNCLFWIHVLSLEMQPHHSDLETVWYQTNRRKKYLWSPQTNNK